MSTRIMRKTKEEHGIEDTAWSIHMKDNTFRCIVAVAVAIHKVWSGVSSDGRRLGMTR
jgi:hypothetical protein